MAWVNPRTWISGELVTAAMLNTHLRDNLIAAETQAVTTAEDLIVGTGITAVTRLAATPGGRWVQIVGGAISSGAALQPSGGIAWFNGDTCPQGWSEVIELRGRTPLGLPAGGAVGEATSPPLGDLGTRVITQVPNHTHGAGTLGAVSGGQHNHAVAGGPSGGYPGFGYQTPLGAISTEPAGAHAHAAAGTTEANGAASVDVTMPYIQLLACRAN